MNKDNEQSFFIKHPFASEGDNAVNIRIILSVAKERYKIPFKAHV